MGSAFARGVISAGLLAPNNVTVADVDPAKLKKASDQMGVEVIADNAEAVKDADVVLLAVKPGLVTKVLADIKHVLSEKQLVISIAAGVTLGTVEAGVPARTRVIRAMPNTPCQIGAGAIGFSRGIAVGDEDAAVA